MTDINTILEQKMPLALEYASHILPETDRFMDFAIELADYMGEEFIPYCKPVYEMLRSLSKGTNAVFEDYETVYPITTERILIHFKHFKRQQEEKQREREFKENIDELQFLVRSFRNKDEFKKLLDFVGRHDYLAPYNAMLVQMQKPGATFIFNGKKWREYGRRPKINAQCIIILKPFGPVQCVFDYGDTEIIPGMELLASKADLMEEWDATFRKIEGDIPDNLYKTLCKNLPKYGIYLDNNFLAANTYGGYIMKYEEAKLHVTTINFKSIYYHSKFIISVNRNLKTTEKFHTICHELGHLFCCHQHYSPSKRRYLTKKEREFEAETVAWLVCKRLGIKNPSEEYLATYASSGDIPICSLEHIMKAVAEIEKMIYSNLNIKDSLWYREDRSLKSFLDSISLK